MKKKQELIDKERIISIVKCLITHINSVLSTKYLHSHEKVAILYKDHVIEINGGEVKSVKYLDNVIPISKKEHKELHNMFMNESKKRKEEIASKKFDDLSKEIQK